MYGKQKNSYANLVSELKGQLRSKELVDNYTVLLHCHHSRDELWPPEQNNNIFVTSKISTMLRRSSQQVSNPVSSIIHDATENTANQNA